MYEIARIVNSKNSFGNIWKFWTEKEFSEKNPYGTVKSVRVTTITSTRSVESVSLHARGNVTSAGWQVTLCDPIWHVVSRSGEAYCKLLYTVYLTLIHDLLFLPISTIESGVT